MYVLDTNVYIAAARQPEVRALLAQFMRARTRHVYLSTVVVHELAVGARNHADREYLRRALAEPFRRDARLLETDAAVWTEAAIIVDALSKSGTAREQLRQASFRFDILLAASCRRVGATLITANVSDFAAINAVRGVRYLNRFPD
jgi:toxin FitB